MKLKALIFDLDGTFAETERDGHRVAFNRAFGEARVGWHWDVALYGQLLAVTGGKERIRYYLEHYQQDFCPPVALDEFIAKLHQAKTRYYIELLKEQGIPLRPGVLRLLHAAREQGLRLAIATTTTPENVTALVSTGIGRHALDWFDCIAAGDIVKAKKPAPDIYDYCLEQLQLEAGQCLAFEDSANGVRAAVDAGIRVVVTVNDYTRDEDFAGADLVLNHLGEPGQPCQVLSGKLDGFEYVKVDLLRRLSGEDEE
ncbi:HAD-superfamily hydrolase subfamily IA, variant 3 [Nitrosococcus oceani ATCC 19707]|uniref:HAD-superfamily hydrolase subfamily IA, variant 3 n=2 Tax=Nitrosococcus oceani TaxID=1229 RepID=Q3JCQ3_NITOC|nr:HAD family hydrolase [Nitrosococcus oceani]ABA57393.1 HAD-superfamily hydrolase subfamily IA, variant 3 [Nitrosococcus oceani ATCC 19707]EDZ66812.1 haloacid dehalogenase-like hydrolase, putative [Nitrosococcus oceani AFC27]KFI20164.1 CbbY [Nitrosococcus oceani C-27]GEM21543.1 phosphatase [Nitrosococcus oceani]